MDALSAPELKKKEPRRVGLLPRPTRLE